MNVSSNCSVTAGKSCRPKPIFRASRERLSCGKLESIRQKSKGTRGPGGYRECGVRGIGKFDIRIGLSLLFEKLLQDRFGIDERPSRCETRRSEGRSHL